MFTYIIYPVMLVSKNCILRRYQKEGILLGVGALTPLCSRTQSEKDATIVAGDQAAVAIALSNSILPGSTHHSSSSSSSFSPRVLLPVCDAVDGDGEGVLEHLLLFLGGVLLRPQPFQNLGLQDVQRVDVRVPDLDEVESIRQRETDSEWVRV